MAVTTRVRAGRVNFLKMWTICNGKKIFTCQSCVRSTMLYGSKPWWLKQIKITVLRRTKSYDANSNVFVSFYLFIFPFDLQESIKGTIQWASNYLNLLPEISRYCCPVKIFIWFFSFIEV